MKTTRHLRLRLRLIEGALVLLLGALTTGAVATHQLLLDIFSRPVSDVSFSSSHWVGTIDPARLPSSVLTFNLDGDVSVPGLLNVATVITEGTDGDYINLTNDGGNILTDSGGGSLDTSNGGGYVATNGYGPPMDGYAPLGSIYTDQDPGGSSGHVLWVMEPGGWVGK